ncbi:hypothetical protein BIW11_12724 [Tropilaelaps mercedesae]|uniref:Uncharacterized protein n=1 Tax=Tropilaelaps mercedesae TaxID=418985 RepID=A0A1V9X5E5_9ACAR|nr:hypothetical protein BIW11_12724 [Tropilaelaps mercedesae]
MKVFVIVFGIALIATVQTGPSGDMRADEDYNGSGNLRPAECLNGFVPEMDKYMRTIAADLRQLVNNSLRGATCLTTNIVLPFGLNEMLINNRNRPRG